jgi:hypothetical protein
MAFVEWKVLADLRGLVGSECGERGGNSLREEIPNLLEEARLRFDPEHVPLWRTGAALKSGSQRAAAVRRDVTDEVDHAVEILLVSRA